MSFIRSLLLLLCFVFCMPAWSQPTTVINPVDKTKPLDILPGKRVGPFVLGTNFSSVVEKYRQYIKEVKTREEDNFQLPFIVFDNVVETYFTVQKDKILGIMIRTAWNNFKYKNFTLTNETHLTQIKKLFPGGTVYEGDDYCNEIACKIYELNKMGVRFDFKVISDSLYPFEEMFEINQGRKNTPKYKYCTAQATKYDDQCFVLTDVRVYYPENE